MNRLSTMLVMMFLVVTISSAAGAAPKEFEYWPATVELTGRFELVIRFGPPNYGDNPKTDRRIEVPVLFLDEPIRVRGRAGDELNGQTEDNVAMLQLIMNSKVDLDTLLGKRVTAKGQLQHSARGPDFTPVLIQVEEIRPER